MFAFLLFFLSVFLSNILTKIKLKKAETNMN